MALWLVRAGKYGEREDMAIKEKVALIGWSNLGDLSNVKDKIELRKLIDNAYPDDKEKTKLNWTSQVWFFLHDIKEGDLIALPLKHRAVIAIGEVSGNYFYNIDNPADARHLRSIKLWKEFPRNIFDQDLLYSLGSASTVCQIRRNEAETRIKSIFNGKGKKPIDLVYGEHGEDETGFVDIEQIARDQISQFINRKYKGHGLARLIAAILNAQGYLTRISPEGADGGVDILAGRGSLGFESPRLAVQVKSSDSPIDVNVLRQLSGVLSKFGADQGLIVAWGGYKGNVERESGSEFFKIRLWDADDVVKTLQENYDRLPGEIQAELPLKKVWMLVETNMEEED